VQSPRHVRDSDPPQAHARVSVEPAVHTPAPAQAPHAPHAHEALQVRDWFPQKPQLCDCVWPRQQAKPLSQPETQSSSAPLHVSAGGVHAGFHVQDAEHVCVPDDPQPVAQLRIDPGVHSPVAQPLHGPHMQVPRHVRVSVPPHVHDRVSVAPGEHTPPPVQLPHAPQAQPAMHVLVCVAHRPQLCVAVAPRQQVNPSSHAASQSSSAPLHVSAGTVHAPHVHAAEQA